MPPQVLSIALCLDQLLCHVFLCCVHTVSLLLKLLQHHSVIMHPVLLLLLCSAENRTLPLANTETDIMRLQASRHVRPAVSHPNSPAAAAAAPATDRLPGYSIGKTIGEGGFCKVRMGVHDVSRQQVAVKVIDKLKLKVGHKAPYKGQPCLLVPLICPSS